MRPELRAIAGPESEDHAVSRDIHDPSAHDRCRRDRVSNLASPLPTQTGNIRESESGLGLIEARMVGPEPILGPDCGRLLGGCHSGARRRQREQQRKLEIGLHFKGFRNPSVQEIAV